jgi:hypothetical protein
MRRKCTGSGATVALFGNRDNVGPFVSFCPEFPRVRRPYELFNAKERPIPNRAVDTLLHPQVACLGEREEPALLPFGVNRREHR